MIPFYDPFDWIISAFFNFLWLLVVILAVYLIIRFFFSRKKQKISDKEKQLRGFDFTKQLYFFLTVFLLNAFLVVVNSAMGDVIPKDVIVLIYAIFGIIVGCVFDAFVALWVSLFAVICALSLRYNELSASMSAQFFGIAILLGILYCLLGQLQRESVKKRVSITTLVAGLFSLFGALLFLSISSGGIEFLSESLGSVVATPLFIFLFALLLLINIFLVYLTLSSKKISLPEFGVYTFLALFSSFLFFAPKQQYVIEKQWNYNIYDYSSHYYGQELTPNGFFMAVVLSLIIFIFSFIVLYVGNSKKNKLIRRMGFLFFIISLFSSFFHALFKAGESGLNYLTMMLNAFLLLVMFGLIYYLSRENKNERKAQFRVSALAIIPISLFMLFFSSRNGLELFEESVFSLNQLYVFSISLILIICSLFYYLFKTSNVFKRIFYPFVLCLFFFCLPLMNFGKSMFVDGIELSGPGLLWSFAFNFFTFLLFLGTILFGYRLKSTGIINIGAVFLFLFIISKYFDWFYSSIDKGIFFIVAGFILLGVGWAMERGRQLLISNINENYAN
jgi:hypothetical protein